MNAEQKIRKALTEIMSQGEANATRIWKGYDVGTGMSGWHYQQFGRNATFIGDNVTEAVEWIDALAEDRQYS